MVKLSDIFYFNLLKKGAIIVVILVILLGIIVLGYSLRWIAGFNQVSEASVASCTQDKDCVEHCGECVSIADSRVCTPAGIQCSCINSTCMQA